MATKYSDIIRIRAGKPAYSIEEERGDEWTSFIPNTQFNDVLTTVLRSVRGDDIDVHKSFWINGTYGTGKSHAAAVIAHLLCDEVADIRRWVDYEYGDPQFDIIRNSIYSLRDKKRLLRVKLEGLHNLTHVSALPALVQTAVVVALNEQDIEMEVDTDYDTLLNHVRANGVIWDDIIRRSPALSTFHPTRQKLEQQLRAKDQSSLQQAKTALREASLNVMLEQDTLAKWLSEVQERLRATSPFTGLLILWDEFTDVMEDGVGIPVLKELQTVAQKFMNIDSDSFIFLISHPSAFNKIGTEQAKQTDGRYHRMKYNMAPVSAFKIMSRKFEVVDKEQHDLRSEFFYSLNGSLLDTYSATSNDPRETRSDLRALFPLHPGTANLATHYATVVGSSSRSVFEFLGQNPAIKEFLENENAYACRDTITANYLWDFVLGMFQEDVVNYGAVTERFNTWKHRVENQGEATDAIFKAILLLNAFNNVSPDDHITTPTEANVRYLFQGTKYADELNSALNWINDNGVIPRAPGGVFSVQFSALPSHELEEIKQTLYGTEFRFTSQILKFGDTAQSIFDKKYLQRVIRPYAFEFFSTDTNDSILKQKIKTAKRNARPSDLFMALLYGRDNDEIARLRNFAEECSKATVEDKDLANIIFMVIDSPFTQKNYDRFIEYMASYKAASSHGFMDQVNVHRDHATEMIKEWMVEALRGNASIYFNGLNVQIALRHLSSTLNSVVAPKIYPLGPDAMTTIPNTATFWKPQTSKEIIRTFMFATSKQDLNDVNSQQRPVLHLVQDALDDNLEWKADIPANHPLKAVYDKVNSTIKNFISHGNTANLFDFTEKFADLVQPPYGLSNNFACEAMVAFAMRPWENKIYDNVGKPRDKNNLVDDIVNLFKYWESGKATNKLSFKFQTPQENRLCKELVKVLKLNKLPGYSDISSMKDARFAIRGVLVEQKGYPLWSLKYMTAEFINSVPMLTMNDEVRKLIDNITAISVENDQKNVQLVTTTLELLEKYRIDFPDILSKDGSFRNGYEQFLLQQPDAELEEDELPDAIEFIDQHLESSIGYRTEEEVAKQLLLWRIANNKRIEQERWEREEAARRKREEEERLKREEEYQRQQSLIGEAKKIVGNPDNVPAKKVAAREYIDQVDDVATLRSLLDKVINLGYEYILDTIINNDNDA